MNAVLTSHNPALLYKAEKSIVLINKPCYFLAWFYNLQHCSFSSSLIAVCIVAAKNPYAAEITFKKLFLLYWDLCVDKAPSGTTIVFQNSFDLCFTHPSKRSGIDFRSSCNIM